MTRDCIYIHVLYNKNNLIAHIPRAVSHACAGAASLFHAHLIFMKRRLGSKLCKTGDYTILAQTALHRVFKSKSNYSYRDRLRKPRRDKKHFYCGIQSRYIIESVDSISRDERGFPLTQYITKGGISRARYTITNFKTPPSCSKANFQ